jgi:hypothetical protein
MDFEFAWAIEVSPIDAITSLTVVNHWVVGSSPTRGCAGVNRHVVGDERALQERSSESVLTPSLAIATARLPLKRR